MRFINDKKKSGTNDRYGNEISGKIIDGIQEWQTCYQWVMTKKYGGFFKDKFLQVEESVNGNSSEQLSRHYYLANRQKRQ